MGGAVKSIINQSLGLTLLERALIAEQLLLSLDRPDSHIDEIWASEAEARFDALDNGEIETVPAENVFGKYNR